MQKKKYVVSIGVEHPGTGHWLPAGTEVELSERQAKIMLQNGHIKLSADVKKNRVVRESRAKN
ncbi:MULTISPECIES: hypothetical protein [Enterobacteriaceae]|uniref:hypothetical protein n=1 Tax=Enterobacteriaceae TaxID=543 RepID=UPI0007952D0F|nr:MULTISPECIES: hypothetical protein [Enterobacteriaceae]ECV6025650.1 hypothetical protein [Salmonella enterica]ECY2423225.1 hypothetical protein [Salmonella enterica]EEH8549834.1 hypothetical protein [Salmonella enterica]EIK0944003.1 hypothetical protein [Salmonella enterica]MCW8353744.1 hypothetical protein [Citrobacter portucalensis]